MMLLERVRAMQPGVTWRDVLPELPTDWVPFDPETWASRPIRFRPLGSFDYQELPVGPAWHIQLRDNAGRSSLEAFIAAAEEKGFAIYGAGLIPMHNPDRPRTNAHVVLRREISEDEYVQFLEWIEQRDGVDVVIFTRSGQENYIVDGPDDSQSVGGS
jgi:hypothetical protein